MTYPLVIFSLPYLYDVYLSPSSHDYDDYDVNGVSVALSYHGAGESFYLDCRATMSGRPMTKRSWRSNYCFGSCFYDGGEGVTLTMSYCKRSDLSETLSMIDCASVEIL